MVIRKYENILLSDGKIVNIHVYSREGLKSPDSWYYEYNGRLITPYEQKIRKWSHPPLNFIFKRVYGHLIEELIGQESFLKKIPKDNIWKGNTWIKPL